MGQLQLPDCFDLSPSDFVRLVLSPTFVPQESQMTLPSVKLRKKADGTAVETAGFPFSLCK